LTTARRVNTGLYRFVRLGKGAVTGLKIRCPKGRAGSTPALGTILESMAYEYSWTISSEVVSVAHRIYADALVRDVPDELVRYMLERDFSQLLNDLS